MSDTEPAAFYQDYESKLAGSGATAELVAGASSSPACGGPWSPRQQHGGPPTALLVLAAEQLAAHASDRSDLVAARVAAEFIGPVPVTELAITAQVRRLSRSAVLISADLVAAGRVCLQARVWLLPPGEPAPRAAEQAAEQVVVTEPDQLADYPIYDFPYAKQLDWRLVSGITDGPGPAAVWVRPRLPLVAGRQLSSLQRAALIGDSASGISAELSWSDWSFANVDLDLHLFRPIEGDWLLLDGQSWLGAGIGSTRSRLSDRSGLAGFGLQTLLMRPAGS